MQESDDGITAFYRQSEPLWWHVSEVWQQYPSTIPDVLVIDYSTVHGFDLAEKFNISVVVSNFGLVRGNPLAIDVDYVPLVLTRNHRHMGVLARLSNRLFQAVWLFLDWYLARSYNTVCSSRECHTTRARLDNAQRRRRVCLCVVPNGAWSAAHDVRVRRVARPTDHHQHVLWPRVPASNLAVGASRMCQPC